MVYSFIRDTDSKKKTNKLYLATGKDNCRYHQFAAIIVAKILISGECQYRV